MLAGAGTPEAELGFFGRSKVLQSIALLGDVEEILATRFNNHRKILKHMNPNECCLELRAAIGFLGLSTKPGPDNSILRQLPQLLARGGLGLCRGLLAKGLWFFL